MAIIDGRTLMIANDSGDAGLVDGAGAASGALDQANFIEGNGSWGKKVSATVDEMMFDAGTAQDWSNQTFYIWAACSFPIATFAVGGLRIRFCGATVTDYFEKNVRGVDTGYSGGFDMLVVDIEKARADATAGTPIDGAVGGTAPATNAIRYVGVVFDVPGMVSGNFNNCNVDAMWRLPASTAGIRVEGQNTGSVDWAMNDLFLAADSGDPTKAWGTVFFEDGVYKINTPIQFGANDAVTHGFSDTNIVVAWIDALVADDFYGWDIIGGSGTQSFEIGVKTGTGNTATGSQGLTMVASVDGGASSYGVRYFINANDANLDAANFYGCSFIHGGDFLLDNALTSVVTILFNDCSSALINGILDFQDFTVVNSNTLDGVAFLTLDDFDLIRNGSFDFSDGHAIEYTAAEAVVDLVGVVFNGFGADGTNDAAIYFSTATAGTTTINTDFSLTERSPTRVIVIVIAPATLLVIVKDADTQALIEDAWVNIEAGDALGDLFFEVVVTITSSGTLATVAHTAHGLSNNDYVNIRGAVEIDYRGVQQITVVNANSYTYVMANSTTSPATGTINSTEMLLSSLTDINGEAMSSRSLTQPQLYRGFARKTDASPFYKTSNLGGTKDNLLGANIQAPLVSDE